MRIVYFGTPEFAATSLEACHAAGHDVLAVVTSPDRRGGRGGRESIVSEVKQLATRLGLPVLQPKNLKSSRFQATLADLRAELFVVVAFRMLPEAVWSMPPLGSINVHGSLLPAYRGAAPIHWAVRAGERETGVSVFFLRHAIDTGDILHTRRLAVGPDDTVGDVYERLQELGAGALLEALDLIAAGHTTGQPQDDTRASHAPKLTRDNTRLDWSLPASRIHDEIRGLSPHPLAWTTWLGQEIKLVRSARLTDAEQQELQGVTGFGESPTELTGGSVQVARLRARAEAGRRLLVRGGDGGWLELTTVRPAGKRDMTGAAWANGVSLEPASRFE